MIQILKIVVVILKFVIQIISDKKCNKGYI